MHITPSQEAAEFLHESVTNVSRFIETLVMSAQSGINPVIFTVSEKEHGPAEIRTQDLRRVKARPRAQMHRPGIEPGLLAWKAKVMPLDHRCASVCGDTLYNLHNEFKMVLPGIYRGEYCISSATCSRAATRLSSGGWVEKSSIRVSPERAGMMKKAFAPSTSRFFLSGTSSMRPLIL
ncbi:MAG: hypothetical protein PWP08_1376 [Methanofollis sp.]|nr:hypothetical protein [Methanofollis sp.]